MANDNTNPNQFDINALFTNKSGLTFHDLIIQQIDAVISFKEAYEKSEEFELDILLPTTNELIILTNIDRHLNEGTFDQDKCFKACRTFLDIANQYNTSAHADEIVNFYARQLELIASLKTMEPRFELILQDHHEKLSKYHQMATKVQPLKIEDGMPDWSALKRP